jgi:MFS transporter, DHA1 family, multidrug resistance protein
MSNEIHASIKKPSSQWTEFLLSLSSIFILAIGTGASLLLIVTFLESRHVPVATIGTAMSVFSFTQAIAVFLIGKYNPGTHFRIIVILALLIHSSGVFLLSTLSTRLLLWIAVSLFGIGLGILVVVLYASAIQRRPQTVRADVSIGIYTALVAGGNAVGAFLAGLVTNSYGYSTAFLSSGAFIFVVIFIVAFMVDSFKKVPLPNQNAQEIARSSTEGKQVLPLWKIGIVSAFLMSSLMSIFDTLLPIYALRAGLAMSVVGALSGLKMFLAAVSLSLTRLLLDKMSSLQVSKLGFLGMVFFTVIFPFSGLGTFLFLVTGMFGISFGAIRVASQTSAQEGQSKSQLITRRLSHYQLSMTAGQITGPYIAGLVATAILVSDALISLALGYFILFLITLMVFNQFSIKKFFLRIRSFNK